MSDAPMPPVAAVRPHRVESSHGSRSDPYHWLRDDSRSDPAVLAHLAAENAYRRAILAPLAGLEQRLYEEIVGRIAEDDTSVPYHDRGHWYFRRYCAGSQYPVYLRCSGTPAAPEQLLLDLNERARGHEHYSVGALEVSPDGRLLAFTEDVVGRRQYGLRIRDLASGELLEDAIDDVEADVVWSADGRSLLYVEKDPQTLLGCRVYRHRLGSPRTADELLYEEPDDAFYLGLTTTKDHRYLIIEADSTLSTELRCARADDPELRFEVLLPRERDHEYDAEHLDGRWIIRSNLQAPNFRLVCAPVESVRDRRSWTELLPHRADAFVEDFEVFDGWVAIEERSGGLARLRLKSLRADADADADVYVAVDETACTLALEVNADIASRELRYTCDSLTTPTTTYAWDLDNGERRLLKRDPVHGGFDSTRYATEYLQAPARDGVGVPVAVVYRHDTPRDGSAPLLQSGYGAYGICSDPEFSASLVSLLDRGFVLAIAQVRGGQELGRAWYDAGRLLHKRNTFTDFIDVTRHLVAQGYADRSRVFACGGSAGGLLMAAVANMAPGEYAALVAHVPFVDVVTTMLDDSLPLTTNEYDEWGDPQDPTHYDYMLSYSPYDCVLAQDYPAMLVTGGLWDSQVQYFEPVKWVARLRSTKTDDNPLLLRIDMDAGHGGKSGRYARYRELAEEYAFLIDRAGLAR